MRYVGVTTNPRKRLIVHISQAKRGRSNRKNYRSTHRDNWINKLLSRNLKPEMEIIEEVSDNWADRERWWISHYKKLNALLRIILKVEKERLDINSRLKPVRSIVIL